MRRDPHRQVQVAGPAAPAALPALSGKPDSLSVDHTGGNRDLIAARSVRPGKGDAPPATVERLLHGQFQFSLLIGSGDGAGRAAGAEQVTDEILEVDPEPVDVAPEAPA